jgi:hypothetical protein
MIRHLVLPVVCVAAACSSGYTTTRPTAGPTPTSPPPTSGAEPSALFLAPGVTRYLVRQNVHVQQDYAGLPPSIDLRYGLYLTATIDSSLDSTGFPTTFTVDSIVVDSGTPIPPQIDLGAARGYRVTGRLLATGEFVTGPCDTTANAAAMGNLLPRFRNFFPRLPAGGVQPGVAWSDSTAVTDDASCSGGSTITTTAQNQRAVSTWEDRDGSRVVRLETTAAYHFTGSGEQGGAQFTLDGSGSGTSLQYLTSDGHYVSGELRDSTTLTIDLPAQGITIPRRQFSHTTITAFQR